MRELHVEQSRARRRPRRSRASRPRTRSISARPSVTGGRVHAESPEWMPASSMCSMTPPMYSSVPSYSASTSISMASSRKRSTSSGVPGRRCPRPRCARSSRRRLRRVVDDLHAAAAEHVARADQHRVADAVCDAHGAREVDRGAVRGASSPAASRMPLNSPRSSARSIASGLVPRIGYAGVLEPFASPSGVCPPSWHDDADELARLRLGVHHLEHVLERERLEVQPVAGVVVGRDGLGVAVDHHGLVARRPTARTTRARTSSRTRRPGRCGSGPSRG